MVENAVEIERRKRVADAASRALAEAEARRSSADASERRGERSGPQGPEPTRYGDWERGGIARDF